MTAKKEVLEWDEEEIEEEEGEFDSDDFSDIEEKLKDEWDEL